MDPGTDTISGTRSQIRASGNRGSRLCISASCQHGGGLRSRWCSSACRRRAGRCSGKWRHDNILRLCPCCEPQQRPGLGTSAWWGRTQTLAHKRTASHQHSTVAPFFFTQRLPSEVRKPQVQALDCRICPHRFQLCCAHVAPIFPNVFELNSVIIYVSTGEIAACPLLCPLLCQHLPFAGALWAAVFLVGRLLLRGRGGSCASGLASARALGVVSVLRSEE